ncbi:MAG: UDP-glucose 4-epimerase [Chlamydiales bacterium]|jgi:UDP-N-acetylglucosamine 4,6-dehydratase|nr:UDP-glucose 4-epimerase [Chlamydiales bacterium]
MSKSQQAAFRDKTILITGGTGSFGRTLARRLLEEDECRKVIIFSRDEWKQWQMRQSEPIFSHAKIRYFLGDVRDLPRLRRAFQEVDYIVHAAALKQVPAAEYNPCEFIKTNVHGAMNILEAAIDAKVQKVVALSTDKAANPINLYGATKLCSDKLFTSGHVYVGSHQSCLFSVVRYGNVLGSRGSIIPFWRKLIKEGASSLPVTDPRMTRFWITLEQAVDFVMNTFKTMLGGEIFVPKIPSMRILDLADAIAPQMPKTITGIREGEKLHELMISADDARHTLEFPSHYIIMPQSLSESSTHPLKELLKTANRVGEEFVYASNTNSEWLSIPALQDTLKKIIPEKAD